MVFAVINPAKAELRVDIFEGTFSPLPIAIHDFVSDGDQEIASNIVGVITNDLRSCGLFKPLDKGAFIQSADEALRSPRYQDWRMINAQALVTGRISSVGDGKFKVEFFLHDVLGEKQMLGMQFTGGRNDWRRIGHKIADAVYERTTNDKGYFDTRIVYAAQRGTGTSKISRVAMIDQDGANHHYLSDSNRFSLTPRISPNMNHIAFVDYGPSKKSPRVYLLDTGSKVQRKIGNFEHMTYAPRFSSDGSKIIMSLTHPNGSSSINVMGINSGTIRNLSGNNGAIDTSADFSPDDRQIVFNSDRGGSQQLYVMNADGSNARRISFGKGRYASPVWSPRGDLIAFTKMEGGQFYIGVMKTDGSGERLIASGYLVEEPTWAPNGRVLTFTRQYAGGSSPAQLYMIDFTGYNERLVPTPNGEDAVSPSWSPLLS